MIVSSGKLVESNNVTINYFMKRITASHKSAKIKVLIKFMFITHTAYFQIQMYLLCTCILPFVSSTCKERGCVAWQRLSWVTGAR